MQRHPTIAAIRMARAGRAGNDRKRRGPKATAGTAAGNGAEATANGRRVPGDGAGVMGARGQVGAEGALARGWFASLR